MATIARDKFFISILIGYILVLCDMMCVLYRSASSLNNIDFKYQVVHQGTGKNIQVNETETRKNIQQQLFDCGNIHRLQLGSLIGQGVTKKVYLATYGNLKFAVKMATIDVKEISECIESQRRHGIYHYLNSLVCYDYTSKKILTEILLLHQIYHPSLARLVGYCFKSHEVRTNVIADHGVVSVFEYGEVVTVAKLNNLTWQDRMRHAYHLADLLLFAENSPIGPLLFKDLKLSHLIEVDSMFKLIDLDGVINHEPICDVRRGCLYDLPCIAGSCKGSNAKGNMERLRDTVLTPMLGGDRLPAEIKPGVQRLQELLYRLEVNAAGLKSAVQELFALA